MAEKKTETQLVPTSEIALKLNEEVSNVLTKENLEGFQKAYVIADAVGKLETMLTAEYMRPMMALQGNKLGFKTDKDNQNGYPESTVKKCLIEAVLYGVQPFGNQFNIIAGNCYITKEGYGHLLKNYRGLSYEIIPSLPRIDAQKGSAAIVMKIKWMLNGAASEREIDFAIKVNQYMGADAVIGKATRKARAWLYATITGFEIADGDVSDTVIENGKEPEITTDDLSLLLEMKKPALSKDEIKNAERIIGENEVKSFKKLQEFLKNK